ncbi:MAG TPA: hypothetical protein PK629_08160 [Oscillospiraceae bacterium]|nr:hypothetical protein [Oscillospiraceae bacterium]HPF55810.1 hypothetical protein [Clostridiales bacterium]HPK35432.1 hypothetical protein [Oscillospiraceae bacterium]HPR75156.1 hypothetical protein [Oscillospiraceae bacterium]
MLSGSEEIVETTDTGSDDAIGSEELSRDDSAEMADETGSEEISGAEESRDELCTSDCDIVMEATEATLEKADDVSDWGMPEQPAENIVSIKAVKNAIILFCSIIFPIKEKAYSANSICCNL